MGVLDSISDGIKKKYDNKKFRIVRDSVNVEVDSISSGSMLLDTLSGVGGIAVRGHVTEVIGANTSGKTTVCIQSCVSAQRRGLGSIYIDAESVFDFRYARSLGLDTDADNFLLLQPGDGDQFSVVLDNISDVIGGKKGGGEVGLVVIDSVATVRPSAEFSGSKQIGLHASMWSKFSHRIRLLASRYDIAFLMVNQVRHNPDISGGFKQKGVLDSSQNSDMDGEATTGGTALQYLFSMRVQLKFSSQIKEEHVDLLTGDNVDGRVGNRVNAVIIKNKLGTPMLRMPLAIIYGRGTVDSYVLRVIMDKHKFIDSKGAYFRYMPLDDSLLPNKEGNSSGEYKGYIYGKKKFIEWFNSEDVQVDVRKRFLEIFSKYREGVDKVISGGSVGSKDKKVDSKGKKVDKKSGFKVE